MDPFQLKYGDTTIPVDLSAAKSVRVLQGTPPQEIEDLPNAFLHAVEDECIESRPLRELIGAEDEVTIVISDITRYWMRQDKICDLLVAYLMDTIGLLAEQIIILVALGTHRPMTEEELEKLAGSRVYHTVRVVNHDCEAPDLKYLGLTSRGTQVFVNPLVCDRKVILIGGTVHHLMSGFGGGRKSILPGVSAKSTIVQNHLMCLDPLEPHSHELIGMRKLKDNPVHEDMIEAAQFVDPVFGINIITGASGGHSRLVCGNWKAAWEESCRLVDRYFGVPIREKADTVVVSCGGFPKDMNLYQGVKSLLNASQCLKDGGTMIFLARCEEGGGAPDFFDWIRSLQSDTLDRDLRENFTIAGYIFYASCEAIRRSRVLMLTELPADTLRDMQLRGFSSMEELMSHVDLTGRTVYVMPMGGNTVPYLSEE
ncbi:nickel-dependent lactate racemase family protein [Massiliimalia timonensis]|uniref:nickel-dependent lactate racemase n=1 Tax=Massiliimalia timonensis TaxID=1987501 RepID=UPI0018A08D09|nr:nickel-dependent lactate racemase [Massiliimalia timonensis]